MSEFQGVERLDVRSAVVVLQHEIFDGRIPRAHRTYFRECVRIACSGGLRLHEIGNGREEWLVAASDLDSTHLTRLDRNGWRCTCGDLVDGVCVHVGAILLWSVA